MKRITVTSKGGLVKIATTGFAGGECLTATAGLKSRLGLDNESFEGRAREKSEELTAEFHEAGAEVEAEAEIERENN